MKVRNTLLLGIACLLVVSTPVLAETTEQAQAGQHPSAAQIVERNVAARGGLKAWLAINSMSMSGKMDAGKAASAQEKELAGVRKGIEHPTSAAPNAEEKTVQLPFTLELKRPLKSRLELEFKGQAAIQVYDGKKGWKMRPYLGRREAEPYSKEETKAAAQQQELDGPLVNYAAKGTKVAYEGIEPVEGHDAYKLKLTFKNGQVRNIWVDAETYLDVKIDGTRRMDRKDRTVFTYFRDYRKVDGVMIPFLLETTVEGVRDSEKILVEKVVLNPKLADARFAKPK